MAISSTIFSKLNTDGGISTLLLPCQFVALGKLSLGSCEPVQRQNYEHSGFIATAHAVHDRLQKPGETKCQSSMCKKQGSYCQSCFSSGSIFARSSTLRL